MSTTTRDSSLAPTLADIPLRPRRKLRDGTSASSRSSSRSSRPAVRARRNPGTGAGRDISPVSAGTSASASTSYTSLGRMGNGRYPARNTRGRDTVSEEEEEYDDGADLGLFGAITDEEGDDGDYVPSGPGAKRGNGRSLRSNTIQPSTNGSRPSGGENTEPASPTARRPLKRPRPPPRSAVPLISTSPRPGPAPTSPDHPLPPSSGPGRSLLEILDGDSYAPTSPASRRRPPEPAGTPPPAPPRQPNESTSSNASISSSFSSSARPLAVEMSSSGSVQEIDELGAPRRFTRAEKGKGRAGVVQVDESPVLGVGKRKLSDVEDGEEVKRRMNGGQAVLGDEVRGEEGEEEEGEGLEEFSCPVCFCNLNRPVMTLCGHVLCADCLHSSLLAAIGRNPNPFPTTYTGPGPAPRARPNPPLPALPGGGGNRPRGTPAQINSRSKTDPAHNPPISSMELQPTEWTSVALLEKVRENRVKRLKEMELEAERQFEEMDMPRENWEAAKLGMGIQEVGAEMETGKVVEEVLKGLWRVPGGHVIEGECPVCRNAIPGGMGPIGSGIGSIIALTPWLEI